MTSAPRPASANGRAARRERIRKRLLAAIEQALEEGRTYNDLTVGWLVGEGKISRATFYTYFEDKGDLLRELSEHVVTDMIEAGQHWWSLPPDASKSDLRESIQPLCDSYRRYGALWGAVVESAAYDPRVREQYEQTISKAVAALAAHIRTGQQAGSITRDLDPDDTAAWITWMGERGLHQIVAPAKEEEAERQAGALTDVIWKLLYDNAR
jgi:TetR/AcrR family transcriptional regulator, ethionamide resistance regulator